jgi:hypothetical protein
MKSTRFLTTGVSLLALAAGASLSMGASAHPIYIPESFRHYHAPLSQLGHVGPYEAPYVDTDPKSKSGKWTDLKNAFPGGEGTGPDTSLLLTNGTVITHSMCTGTWYQLTPDSKGSYVNGTWAALASMPTGYYPYAFASQVLTDGRVIMNGGEYNHVEGNCGGADWTKLGALYDPVANSWTAVSPPTSWASVGDAQSIILPDGSYMLADCCSEQEAIATITGTKVTWTTTGTGKGDINDEEGWTPLPDGNVFTVDVSHANVNTGDFYEIYDTSTGTWTTEGQTASYLSDTGKEMGPAVLRPDGTIIQFGANTSTGYNNLYTISTGTWVSAPSFPAIQGVQMLCYDAPGVLLPDGNVLVDASPPNLAPSHFFEFSMSAKGKMKLAQVNDPKSAPDVASFEGHFLELPTGQIFWTNDDQTGSPEQATYTPKGAAKKAWLPVISSVATTLTVGSTGNAFSGTNFNGFSQGASFGDDSQSSTNYPVVRITNNSTGDVCFGRSYNFSTMGVWTQGTTNAVFDLPSTCETGASKLQVIVNGLASAAMAVTLQS